MAKNCMKCGAPVDEEQAFCSSCGSSQKEPEITVTPVQPEENAQSKADSFVYFDTTKIAEANKNRKPKDTKRKGLFIAAIICFVIGLLFTALYGFRYIQILAETDENLTVLWFVLYVLFIGWFTILPAAILMIATIALTACSVGSSSKAIKVISILLMIASILIVVAIVISFVIPSLINVQPPSSSAFIR